MEVSQLALALLVLMCACEMTGMTQALFRRGVSRLTRIDLLAECTLMVNFCEDCSTLSTLTLLAGLHLLSLPGASTPGCRVVHPGMFARIHIDGVTFKLVQ